MEHPAYSQDGRPIELMILVDEANEALFDGDYERAEELQKRTKAWLADVENRETLIARGFDYGVFEGFNHLTGAQIQLHAGNLQGMRYEIQRAKKLLETRRTYYLQRGGNGAMFWLCAAFLELTEGDANRPGRIHLRFDENGEAELPFDDLLNEKSRTAFAKKTLDFGDYNIAQTHYDQAGKLIEQHLGLVFGSTAGGGQELEHMAHHLMTRLFIARAHMSLARHDHDPKSSLADAESYLVRAKELQQMNPLWEILIPAGESYPLPYSTFQEETIAANAGGGQAGSTPNAEGQDSSAGPQAAGGPNRGGSRQPPAAGRQPNSGSYSGGSGGAGGPFGNQGSRTWTEHERLFLKKYWTQTVFEWVQLTLLEAEVHAIASDSGQSDYRPHYDIRQRDTAEYLFKRVARVLQGMFSAKHPMTREALHSLASWQLHRLDLTRANGVDASEALAAATVCQDALVTIRIANDNGRYGTPADKADAAFVELRLLETLYRLDNEFSVLTDEQRRDLLDAAREEVRGVLSSTAGR